MNKAQKIQEVINKLDGSSIEKNLADTERKSLEAWKEAHYKTCEGAYEFDFIISPIGTSFYVICSCSEIFNITDYSLW